MDNDVVKHWAQASLSIYSRTLSVADLERLVPFPPDRFKEKGTPRSRRRPGNLQPHSVVTYESQLSQSESIERHLDALLSRIEPAKDALREFAQHARSEFPPSKRVLLGPVALSLWVYSTEASSGVLITPDQLKAILDLGVNLNVALDADIEDDRE